MSQVNVEELAAKMLEAAKNVFSSKWPEAKDYAESEFKKIAESVAFIEAQCALGVMNKEKAKLHLNMQKNASKMMLLCLEGLGLLTVEKAINAALAAVKDTVNTALGFAIL